MTLKRRLDRLEEAHGAEEGWRPFVEPTDEEVLAEFEDLASLPRGHISRTPAEASAKGYGSVAEEMAHALGLTPGGLKHQLEDRAADGDGLEHRWVGATFPRRHEVRG